MWQQLLCCPHLTPCAAPSIVFNMEGPSGMKGKVFAEMRSDQKGAERLLWCAARPSWSDCSPRTDAADKFHYLIVQKLNTGEVITIQDNRAPEVGGWVLACRRLVVDVALLTTGSATLAETQACAPVGCRDCPAGVARDVVWP